MDNLEFDRISDQEAGWLGKEFEVDEVRAVMFDLGGNKSTWVGWFFHSFSSNNSGTDIKEDIMALIKEFHSRGKLSKSIRASFIVLIPKIAVKGISDYQPINLISCMYKILSKVVATRLHRMLRSIIFKCQGAFVHGRQILDGMLIANECLCSVKWLICRTS